MRGRRRLRERLEHVQKTRRDGARVAPRDAFRRDVISGGGERDRRVAEIRRAKRRVRAGRIVSEVRGVKRVQTVQLRQQRQTESRPPAPFAGRRGCSAKVTPIRFVVDVRLVGVVVANVLLRLSESAREYDALRLVRGRDGDRALRGGPRAIGDFRPRIRQRLPGRRGRLPTRFVHVVGVYTPRARQPKRRTPLLRVHVRADHLRGRSRAERRHAPTRTTKTRILRRGRLQHSHAFRGGGERTRIRDARGIRTRVAYPRTVARNRASRARGERRRARERLRGVAQRVSHGRRVRDKDGSVVEGGGESTGGPPRDVSRARRRHASVSRERYRLERRDGGRPGGSNAGSSNRAPREDPPRAVHRHHLRDDVSAAMSAVSAAMSAVSAVRVAVTAIVTAIATATVTAIATATVIATVILPDAILLFVSVRHA